MSINKQILDKIREKAADNKKVADSIEILLNAVEESKQPKRIIDGILKKI